MNCKQCAENLTALLDAELSATETEEALRHLRTCACCSEEFDSLSKTSNYIESHISEINPNPKTWRLIQARIADVKPSVSPFRYFYSRWRFPAIAGLTLALLSGFGYFQYQQYEKRNLERHIAKYLQQRNAWLKVRTASFPESGIPVESPYKNNPFIEVKTVPADNPFRLEDR
jgi:anti-sigma factor RsiW